MHAHHSPSPVLIARRLLVDAHRLNVVAMLHTVSLRPVLCVGRVDVPAQDRKVTMHTSPALKTAALKHQGSSSRSVCVREGGELLRVDCDDNVEHLLQRNGRRTKCASEALLDY